MAKRRKRKQRNRVVGARPAGPDHQVVTITGQGEAGYCTRPCPQCPWRKDQAGSFPAEAFRHSANTAYDMDQHTFACHMAGVENPKICAGFLLNGAAHNMTIRLAVIRDEIDLDKVTDGGHELHESYRAMAEANGVPPDDPALAPCREP